MRRFRLPRNQKLLESASGVTGRAFHFSPTVGTATFEAMTRTARRRFTRELPSVVDGIAFTDTGPVLLHVYDPPAGGMWVDDVIPGKLAALDRHTGETLWLSPCEVGYGRGFGAGFGPAKIS